MRPGIKSIASGAVTVTEDTVAPLQAQITAFEDDSGANGDGITSDNTLLLSGTAEAGSTVTVYDDKTLIWNLQLASAAIGATRPAS